MRPFANIETRSFRTIKTYRASIEARRCNGFARTACDFNVVAVTNFAPLRMQIGAFARIRCGSGGAAGNANTPKRAEIGAYATKAAQAAPDEHSREIPCLPSPGLFVRLVGERFRQWRPACQRILCGFVDICWNLLILTGAFRIFPHHSVAAVR